MVIERIPKRGLVAASENELLVAIETGLTPDLIKEGLAREFVSKIQNMRKDAGLEVTQRIRIEFSSDNDIREAVETFSDYIATETLSLDTHFTDSKQDGGTEWDLNGHLTVIRINAD